MAEDDSQKVRTVVAAILKAHTDEKPLVSEPHEPATALPKKTEAPPIPPAILRVKPATALPKKTEAPPTPPAILRKLLVVLVVVILGGGLYHVGKGWFEKPPAPPSPVTEIRSSTPPGIEESASTVTTPARQESAAKSPSLTPTPPGVEESASTVTTPARQESTAKSPSLPPLQTIHGWSAQQVRGLQQQTAQALKISVEFQDNLKDGGQGPVMVVIPGGRFQVGSPPEEWERGDDERQHEVEVAPFALGKYEVTFEEYDRFAKATGRFKPADQGWGRGRRPVISVSWVDAMDYADWLSRADRAAYRLPTEAEWEYAARAGTTTPFLFRHHDHNEAGQLQWQLRLWRGTKRRVSANDHRGWPVSTQCLGTARHARQMSGNGPVREYDEKYVVAPNGVCVSDLQFQ
ncbi:MAG: SUMF1/EgtB/PvdO family nonheme iron enzyme [Desulfomicrobium escambiense]|nr:SUMF1/EgtB/PvdO family nonheme iron enzyme [Desulfomicrobium escambiense]